MKIIQQIRAPPGHVKDKLYPKQVTQEGDVQRYGGMKTIRKDETIFAAYDKPETRKAKIMIVANSDFVHTCKSLFWPDVIMLAAVDHITIVFADISYHLHSRSFLSRLREPTTTEHTIWPATKDILESMGGVVNTLKEGAFPKITWRAVFALSPGYAHLSDGLKFVSAIGREI